MTFILIWLIVGAVIGVLGTIVAITIADDLYR